MEFYAKITPMKKGAFNYCSTIWKSDDHIDSIWNMKKFFLCNSARKWSEKQITKSAMKNNNVLFIKELDIIRRNWND